MRNLYMRRGTQCWTMMLLKTWCLLFVAVVSVVAEVVNQVSDCDQFLLEKSPPHVPHILEDGKILDQNRYKTICQTYADRRRFVTLYDVKNRIPVFSAYKYSGTEKGKRPNSRWKIEPQLENIDNKNMREGHEHKLYDNQAGSIDYAKNAEFDRGHLFPSSHAFNRSDKKSTFTLTNIIPQARTFNQLSWGRMETCVKCVMEKYCINNNGVTEGFVVTGAEPSTNNTLNNRVNIPSKLWSAFCCYSSNEKKWIAGAYWGDNVPDGAKDKHLQTKTLEELQTELKMANAEFEVFPGTQCPLHTTVSEFYPEINNCSCPDTNFTASAPPALTAASLSLKSTSAPVKSTSAPITSTPDTSTLTPSPYTSTSGSVTSTPAPPTSKPVPVS